MFDNVLAHHGQLCEYTVTMRTRTWADIPSLPDVVVEDTSSLPDTAALVADSDPPKLTVLTKSQAAEMLASACTSNPERCNEMGAGKSEHVARSIRGLQLKVWTLI